jgi:hypothetical protein
MNNGDDDDDDDDEKKASILRYLRGYSESVTTSKRLS